MTKKLAGKDRRIMCKTQIECLKASCNVIRARYIVIIVLVEYVKLHTTEIGQQRQLAA